ncbi:MAG: hypothetical protein PHG35_03710, partial [Dehalococcoidales bacterium]|nr:hypothetical protein [Dehalococcoidales bacterium]
IPHTLEVPEVINVDSGTRFAFTGWNDGVSSASRVVTHGSLQANYQKEYLLTINSPYGNPTGAGWYAMGATASFSVTDYVETLNTRRTFNGWSGAFSGATASGTLLMDSPKTITADWSSQYLLTINSEYGAPIGAGWYNESQSANVSVDSSTGSIIKQVFDGWTGDITTTNPSTSIDMNGPKVITAAWHTDLMMLYIIIIVVVVVVAGVITFVVLRRRGGTPGAAATAGTPPASTRMTAHPPVEPPPPGGTPSPPSPPPPPTR